MNKDKKLSSYFKIKGGIASYSEIIDAGFNKIIIREALNSGEIQKLDRGLYAASNGITLSHPDFVAVSKKAPKGIICLLSALAYYELTDEIPRYVDIAIPRGAHANLIKYPPVHFYHFSPKTWKPGVENIEIEGYNIKIYSIAKTIADSFKFRNKIGIDIVREAMKAALNNKGIRPNDIMGYAKICRVDKIIKPILETMLIR